MMRIRHVRSQSAFSLMELLVVIAIIALLTGMLAPGIGVITRAAKRLKQSSVFHGYKTGLELFSRDFNDYPESDVLSGAGGSVYGAQRLAEALMGIDQKGFDPKSKWYAPNHGPDIYASTDRVPASSAAEIAACDNRRKEIYVEQKDDGCYALADIYSGGSIAPVYSPSGFEDPRAPVLTDIFKKKYITLTTPTGGTNRVKVGTPVLYFKADTRSRLFMGTDLLGIGNRANWVYNYEDNRAIIELGTVLDPTTVKHDFDESQQVTHNGQTMDGMDWFYETIKDSRVDAYDKPHNPKTFILMSAGPDGVFGTKDDVTNFD